jgi:hypothetical protein
VLVLILIVAAFCASALDEAVTNRALAGARLAQQRAFLAASSGLQLTIADLQKEVPVITPREFPLASPADHVRVETRRTLSNPLPAGFSAGRFVEQYYELKSEGRSLRGARALQTQGLRRIEAANAPGVSTAAP